MAADINLIKGEALVAQSGNINYGEEIGKGLETIAKSVTEAKDTVKGWNEEEAELNEAMALVDTDDLLSKENEVVSEFLAQGKQKYAEAARKASRMTNKSSKEYKNLVKIMNNVNTSFKNLAKEKQDILDARAYLKDNPNAFSAANGLDEDAMSYMRFAKGEIGLLLNEEGHFFIKDKEFRNLKAPSTKSPVNGILRENLDKAYLSSQKSGRIFSNNELENAGKDVEALFAQATNKKLLARQLLLDPILGVETLAGNVDIRGLEEPELIQLVKNSYMDLLKDQSTRGKQEHRDETQSKTITYYDSDNALEGLAEYNKSGDKDGSSSTRVGERSFMVVKEEEEVTGVGPLRKPKTKLVPKIVEYVIDPNTSKVIQREGINLYKKDGTINFSGFRSYTGSTIKGRTK
jgi:hypothetical protein